MLSSWLNKMSISKKNNIFVKQCQLSHLEHLRLTWSPEVIAAPFKLVTVSIVNLFHPDKLLLIVELPPILASQKRLWSLK